MSKEYTLEDFFRTLAGENITIIEGPFETASADVKNRTMKIPSFSKFERDIRILFGSHEVGHFLFTPESLLHEALNDTQFPKALFPFVNIIEDVRIEKKIKNKYPGLIKSFRSAYEKLLERGFFGDVSKLTNFADRFNVFTKAGNSSNIVFHGRDLAVCKYLQSIDKAEDVIKFAKFLYLYSKETTAGKDLEQSNQGSAVEKGSSSSYPQGQEVTFSDDLEVIIEDTENEPSDANDDASDNLEGGVVKKIIIKENKEGASNTQTAPQKLPQNVIDKINEKLKKSTYNDFAEDQDVKSVDASSTFCKNERTQKCERSYTIPKNEIIVTKYVPQ